MQEDLLREIAEEYLLPFFAGAHLQPKSRPSTAREELVALESPLEITFKVNRNDKYRLVLTRSQSFSSESKPVIREIEVVRAFVDTLASMEDLLSGPLKLDLLSTFQRRVVARAIRGSSHEEVILKGIDQMARWGNRLYEGSPISASLGFRSMSDKFEYPLDDIVDHDFSAVLSKAFIPLTHVSSI